MGSEWHRCGHPLPEPSPILMPTLPSVTELLASSRPPASDSLYRRPGDSVPPAPVQRPVSRSTPPIPPTSSAPANTPTTAERSWTAINRASPQVSPTDTTALATASGERQYPPQHLQPTALSVLTPETSQSLLDAAHSQTPINSQRQDSAISQQRIETWKEAPSSDLAFSHPNQSQNNSRHSTSPRSNSRPTTPTSPFPPVTQPSIQRHSKSPPLDGHVPAEPSRPHEYVTALSAPVRTDSSSKSMGPSTTLDQTNNTSTRQQRYNVRFIANYTSENMPPSQKPRHDPALTVSAPVEITEPQMTSQELPATLSVEPSISSASSNLPPAEDQPQPQRRRDPSVERCAGCHEAWKRPLPNTEQYRHNSPAENSNELSRMSMNMIAQLVDHGKKADAMYDRWKWKHSHCLLVDDYDISPPTPSASESQDGSHTTSGDGASRDNKYPDTRSNKRKSEVLHDDGQQLKVRKVTFEAQPTAAPPVRPSAPA